MIPAQSKPPATNRRLLLVGATTAGLVLAVIGAPLILGQVYEKDDLGIFDLSSRFFYATSLARGDGFIWWPNLLNGFYLHGEGQAGMFHPVHLLLYRVLPLETAFNSELLLSYPVVLSGTYLFLRRWDINAGGAIFGAFEFTFSSFNLLHFVHSNLVAEYFGVMLAGGVPALVVTPSNRIANLGVYARRIGEILANATGFISDRSLNAIQ